MAGHKPFIYPTIEKAEQDAEIYSGMNMHEGHAVFVISSEEGFYLLTKIQGIDVARIKSIFIDRKKFS